MQVHSIHVVILAVGLLGSTGLAAQGTVLFNTEGKLIKGVSDTDEEVFNVDGNGNAFFDGAVTADAFVGDGSGLTNLPGGGGDGWSLTGNAGTNPATNFLGTTDDTALNLRVNDQRALRLEPHATSPNVIGGFADNTVAEGVHGASIGGGGRAFLNQINQVTSNFGTVSGGESNTASGESATVGGGLNNTASATRATVSGGTGNTASGLNSAVGGGPSNTAGGVSATVPGGGSNTADGNFSFAAGRRAKANDDGAFVWADSTNADFASERADQFRTRANGGVRFDVNESGWLEILDDETNLITTSTGATLTLGGTWTSVSDAALKENFDTVDAGEVLVTLAGLPVQGWNYKAEGAEVHRLGPTAQDFHAAFGLGTDDKTIGSVDAHGVAFAAIQALYERSLEKDRRIEALEAELLAVRTLLGEQMDKQLASME